jgi:hypothetical protein
VTCHGRFLPFLLAGVAVLTPLITATPVQAAGSNAGAVALSLRVQADPARPSVLLLSAQLQAQGHPLGNGTVRFLVHTTTFGSALMSVGSATTDVTGTAVLPYRPTWTGPHRFVARFARGGGPVTEARASFSVATASSPYRPESEPLPGVRYWLVRALLATVSLVWAMLVFLLLRAVFGLPQLAQPTGGEVAERR